MRALESWKLNPPAFFDHFLPPYIYLSLFRTSARTVYR
jgi:hypothetical protein